MIDRHAALTTFAAALDLLDVREQEALVPLLIGEAIDRLRMSLHAVRPRSAHHRRAISCALTQLEDIRGTLAARAQSQGG